MGCHSLLTLLLSTYPFFNGQDGKPQHYILAFTVNGTQDIGIHTKELVSRRGLEDAIQQASLLLDILKQGELG